LYAAALVAARPAVLFWAMMAAVFAAPAPSASLVETLLDVFPDHATRVSVQDAPATSR
jgi:hypothetical protein